MSFLPDAVDGKTHALKTEGIKKASGHDRHDNWFETENCFFDATVSENEWNIDTQPRDDAPASDARPSTGKSCVITIGFLAIRL